MNDISLHILDLVQNSIKADASIIETDIYEDTESGSLTIRIKDNGKGMDKNTIANASNPFYTTRRTRRVGLGLPLLKFSAESTGGSMDIESSVGTGTKITAVFNTDHIDCLPLGSMADTMTTLILCNPDIDFIYTHRIDHKVFMLNTVEIKEVLDGVPITNPEVIGWIREYIREGLTDINGGV